MNQLILIIFFSSFGLSLSSQTSITMVKTDFEGKVTYGSIDSLIAGINQGKKLRIGWQLDFDQDGKGDLEHWIDAEFISILNGHVFNQITPIFAQRPLSSVPQISLIESSWKWTAIIGTNGYLQSKYVIPNLDKIDDEKLRSRLEQKTKIKERKVATTWVLK